MTWHLIECDALATTVSEQQTHERRQNEISTGPRVGATEFRSGYFGSIPDRFQIISPRLHMKEINDANHDFLICNRG